MWNSHGSMEIFWKACMLGAEQFESNFPVRLTKLGCYSIHLTQWLASRLLWIMPSFNDHSTSFRKVKHWLMRLLQPYMRLHNDSSNIHEDRHCLIELISDISASLMDCVLKSVSTQICLISDLIHHWLLLYNEIIFFSSEFSLYIYWSTSI